SFHCFRALRDLHSFPTRRSSDLVRFGSARRWFAILVLSLLTALSLAIAPAQARNLFATEQTQNLFVANQSTNTIREFSPTGADRSEEHTSELQSRSDLVCRLLLE